MSDNDIEALGRLAKKFGFDQVVLVARTVGKEERVVTWGKNREHCNIAARMGNRLKREVMGWPEESL